MERDRLADLKLLYLNYFNSHAHVERDVRPAEMAPSARDFNSHAHVERDRRRNESEEKNMNFNSHAHVERDLLTY